ncbi:alpha-L-rhamnosidase-related protein [Mucilaginibacter gossypii]|uniref:Alpha-L-rhamnosidase six-hairpin glycosidase domain-containing protein n=1 Tax=Mucilaginibacter gossypii TaxID=551996 RepID=A0A1G8AJQ6_9SPHI|nr:hypothetical protein [Mucilaginibacter gossypii]SDH21252.1 hypothetical protein SAMN05192573_107224 [Mucilaginibacter gossypii]
MFIKRVYIKLIFILAMLEPLTGSAKSTHKIITDEPKTITISTPKLSMVLNYNNKASVTSLVINGKKVISSANGIYTSIKAGGITYSSLHLKSNPMLIKTADSYKIDGISYGDKDLTINESWTFIKKDKSIKWLIERKLSKQVKVDEAAMPVFNFDDINTWNGAYQGYGGLAWFYLFNEPLCTYGVHTRSSSFWNSKNGIGLNITVDAPGKEVAMKYTRTNENKLAYTVTVSNQEMLPHTDSGTNRRRFIRKATDVWSAFNIPAGKSSQSLTFSYFDYNDKYGRGKLAGINGDQVNAVLSTIARIGVIDSLHFGGNSWHTPYGPVCLHEQYIAQLGLGINDPNYLKGYKSCLDFYRDHAIKPDGRVYPRWAYTNEDAMPGEFNKYGFYEAQWGILVDSNPDFVTNVAELYDMTGDKAWVKTHQLSCEKALDWILKRDSNNNGLVEMMTDNQAQKQSSDWIDIIWASYENAFVNANLYHALVKWADIENQLNNHTKAQYYENFAAKLKTSFNKSTSQGGFWDDENKCYIHWRDKDQTIHGRNMVTPVNFMAIAYDICDDDSRKKLILDNIENQMQKENLFFWPLAMTSYAPGEGKDWQWPFPGYENGDLFLSWGAVGVKAYASYNPALAVKYVKNVLDRYSKDGLAFQRYGRLKQDGLGDDILSGNSLSIVGLYQAIYGVNPLYNRFYLDPHITPELEGTALKYNFRDQRLTVNLDNDSYAVSNQRFKVICNKNFGFNATKNQLSYFNGSNPVASLQITTDKPLTISVSQWSNVKMEWQQTATKPSAKALTYLIKQLKPNANYIVSINGKAVQKVKSDDKGDISITHRISGASEKMSIGYGN